MADTLIALGANLGHKRQALETAIERLGEQPGVRLLAVSSLLETQPIGVPDSDAGFVNCAARFEVELEPAEWFQCLVAVEQELGRARKIRWGARSIDLDLLLFGQAQIQSAPLWIPHPRMGFRRFVMQGAVEIAADMLHPDLGWTLGEIWAHLNRMPNWILVEASESLGPESLSDPPLAVATRWLARQADPANSSEWLDAERWLQAAPVDGPHARAVVVEAWPPPSELIASRFAGPKLVVRRANQAATYGASRLQAGAASRAASLELVLDPQDASRHRTELRAAIESMLLL